MIIYLPYKNLTYCVKVLPDDLLKSQVSNTKMILSVLKDKNNPLYSEPGILMWANYRNFLKKYQNTLILEMQSRKLVHNYKITELKGKARVPSFLGKKEFHDSHKAALLRLKVSYLEKAIKYKDENYIDLANKYYRYYRYLNKYCKWKDIDPELPYYWPTKQQ